MAIQPNVHSTIHRWSSNDGLTQRIYHIDALHLPDEEVWLIGEHCSTGDSKHYLSNLPAEPSVKQLASAFKDRWVCEQAHQQPRKAQPRPLRSAIMAGSYPTPVHVPDRSRLPAIPAHCTIATYLRLSEPWRSARSVNHPAECHDFSEKASQHEFPIHRSAKTILSSPK